MNKANNSSSSYAQDEEKPQPESLRWIKTFVLLLILLACVVYPMLKIRWAHNQVESFCMAVPIGTPVHGLEEKAKERGLKILKFKADSSHPAKITVWEGWAFARWNCVIEHVNGKVVGKKIFFLD
jgi:hypothetical protein